MTTNDLFTLHRLVINVDDAAGGLPADPRMIDAWQQANWRAAKVQPGDPRTPEEAADRTLADLEGIPEEKGFTVFPRDSGYLCLEGRQIKAMLKEAANILRTMMPINGKVVPLRSKLAERVFVIERLLRFIPKTTEPDDVIERAIHVMTAQGPRDALKRTEVVRDRAVLCTLKVLNDGLFTVERLATLLDYASENGLGADRSQGLGRFTWEWGA